MQTKLHSFGFILVFVLLLGCERPSSSGDDDDRSGNLDDSRVQYRPNEVLLIPRDFDSIEGRYLTREQLDEIRNHFVTTRNTMAISGITSDGCVSELDTFTITGDGFGATPDGHTVWLSIRSVDLAQADIVSWSDTEIVARFPSLTMSGRYNVGIKNADGRYVSNRNRTIEHCPIEIPSIGVPAPDYVHPEMCFALDSREGGLDYECEDGGRDCRVVDGSRVVHDFETEGVRNEDRARDLLFFLLDEEIDEQCIGPTPPPFFRAGELVRNIIPFTYFKKDGAIYDYGGGSLGYGMRCRHPRELSGGVPWDLLEARLSAATGYWVVGFPDLHADREFGFIGISSWNTQADANWVVYMHKFEGLRLECSLITDEVREVGFSYWTY